MQKIDELTEKYRRVMPLLDERQCRLYLAAEAVALGRGGIEKVARASGASRERIARGIKELEEDIQQGDRVRKKGAGRKSHSESHPEVVEDLLKLVAADTRGDPMSPLLWTSKSTYKLAAALKKMGHVVSHDVVSRILTAQGYSLQANVKTREGGQHVDRDAQFEHINREVQRCLSAGLPVLSLDCKKKELVGNFKNGGREWQPKRKPVKVNVHDFMDKDLGKAIPYGIYDVGRNEGWVSVGCDHDTAEFAVNALRNWYQSEQRRRAYPRLSEMYLCMDGGGSNNWRSRLWKEAIVGFAREVGLTIRVSHLPPGTSKWNKIEHRLFSHITMNWRGKPLTSHEVIVESIKATTTSTGLKVHAELDPAKYATGKKVSDARKEEIERYLLRDDFHGEWNYTATPSSCS